MVSRLALGAIAIGFTVMGSGEARADWDGAPMIATDAGGWALVIGGAVAESRPVIVSGIALAFAGGPVVHAAHDNYGRMGISAGLRLGGALLGWVAGGGASVSSRRGPGDFSGIGAVGGAMIGVLIAQIIDNAVVAHEDADPGAQTRMLSIGGRF